MVLQNLNVTIPDTQIRMISSSNVGDTFKLYLSFPPNYSESTKYPILFLLDPNIFFGIVADIVRLLQFGQEIPDIVIVGIGYPDDDQHLGLRSRDYTPTVEDVYTRDYIARMSSAMPVPVEFKSSGGADKFLAFIVHELMPYLEEREGIAIGSSILAGSSYSGLFGLYTLFHRPETFQRYIIGSPSIWWDCKVALKYEAEYAENHSDLPAKVFISVGELETREPEPAAMVTNFKTMVHRLESRHYPNLKLTSHIFEGETHLSVIPAAMSRGLRVVLN
ncbi:MAG: alpha/beta hydrolase [Anaerolineales bacterium]|nr:alpha/beta hydrolase [Anaerolineales bacterium]